MSAYDRFYTPPVPPSLTTTQRDALASVPTGAVIFNSTLGCLQAYNGAGWKGLSATRLFEGIPLTEFGDSYGYSIHTAAASGYSTYRGSPVNRLARRLGMVPSIRNRNGTNMQWQSGAVMGGFNRRPWIPGTDRGIIVLQTLRNDVAWWGATGKDTNGQAQTSFKNALRTCLRWWGAGAPTAITSGTGAWAVVLDTMAYDSQYLTTSTAGDFVEFQFTGQEVIFAMKRLNYDTAAGTIEVVYDPAHPTTPSAGSVIATIDGGHGFDTTPSLPYLGLPYYWHTVRLTATDFGDAASPRKIRVRKKTGDANPVTLGPWWTPGSIKPFAMVVNDGDESPYFSALVQGGNVDGTVWNTWRALQTSVLAEAEFTGYAKIVDLPLWVPSTMTDSASPYVHPNDAGAECIADGLENVLCSNVTSYTNGVHIV